MAIYRSIQAVTTQNRATAYDRVAALMRHLHDLNLNLVRIQVVAVAPDNFVEVELNNPLPAAQVAHLGLAGPL